MLDLKTAKASNTNTKVLNTNTGVLDTSITQWLLYIQDWQLLKTDLTCEEVQYYHLHLLNKELTIDAY